MLSRYFPAVVDTTRQLSLHNKPDLFHIKTNVLFEKQEVPENIQERAIFCAKNPHPSRNLPNNLDFFAKFPQLLIKKKENHNKKHKFRDNQKRFLPK